MKKSTKILLNILLVVVVLAVGFLSPDLGQASIFRKPTVQNVEPEAGVIFEDIRHIGTDFRWDSNANGYRLVGNSLCFEKYNHNANRNAIFCSDFTTNSFLQVGGTAQLGWDDILNSLYGTAWPTEAKLNWHVKSYYKKMIGDRTFFVKSKAWPVTLEINAK